MSSQITTAFVQQYKDTFHAALVQQKGSRLKGAVHFEGGVKGEAYYFDQFGKNEGEELLTRNADSPLHNTPHARRRVDPRDWVWGELIDEPDKLRMLIDPAGSYLQAAKWGAGRFLDARIIEAFHGSAKTGKAGGTSTVFLPANIVAVDNHSFDSGAGNVGLTVGKLIAARDILGSNEADSMDEEGNPTLFLACPQKQISNMLTATEVASADYNSVKALTNGTIDTFMGFKFIRTQLTLATADPYDRVMAWHKMGMGLAVWDDIETNLAPRADKNFNPYAHAKQTLGATRLEEERCVEILCTQ